MKTTSVAASFSVNFFSKAGISPLIPFKMVDLIRSSVLVTLWRSGPSSPVASMPWQCAQLMANSFAPAATFGSWLTLIGAADRAELGEMMLD